MSHPTKHLEHQVCQSNCPAYTPDLIDRLVSKLEAKANVYNVKSTNGEMNPPNTGIMAVPLSDIKAILLNEKEMK